MSYNLDDSMLELINSSWPFVHKEHLSSDEYSVLLNRRVWSELHQESTLAQIHQVLADPKGPLLDYGCGEGGLVVALRKRGVAAFGVDVRRKSVEISQLRSRRYDMPNSSILYDGTQLPFGDAVFEYITSVHVFEHVDDHVSELHINYLREAKRVLKPGGKMFISFPNAIYPKEVHTRIWFFSYLLPALRTPILKLLYPQYVETGFKTLGSQYPVYFTPVRALQIIKTIFPEAYFVTDQLLDLKLLGKLTNTGMRLLQILKPLLSRKIGMLLYRHFGKQIAIVAPR